MTKIIKEAAYFLGAMFGSLLLATVLWGQMSGQWWDESVGGHAFFMIAVCTAVYWRLAFASSEQIIRAYAMIFAVSACSAAILSAGAIANLAWPQVVPLSLGTLLGIPIHVAPISWVISGTCVFAWRVMFKSTES